MIMMSCRNMVNGNTKHSALRQLPFFGDPGAAGFRVRFPSSLAKLVAVVKYPAMSVVTSSQKFVG